MRKLVHGIEKFGRRWDDCVTLEFCETLVIFFPKLIER